MVMVFIKIISLISCLGVTAYFAGRLTYLLQQAFSTFNSQDIAKALLVLGIVLLGFLGSAISYTVLTTKPSIKSEESNHEEM